MDRRIETRVIVNEDAGEVTTIIQKDACNVWWVSVSPVTAGQKGLIKIYDGFDTNGKLQWRLEPAYAFTHNAIPPIPCDYGLTIYIDAKVASYTVGYSGKGWPREQ